MGHITGLLRSNAERDQLVLRPKRAVEEETIRTGDNPFNFRGFCADARGISKASAACDFIHEQRDIVVDLRFDKQFRVSQRDRISVYLDINNVLNDDSILDYQDLAPSRTITGIGPIPVGAPASLAAPRQITIGGRWAF